MKPAHLVLLALLISGIASAKEGAMHTATVAEVLQAPSYTYLRVKEGGKEVWIAAPTTKVSVGEEIRYSDGLPMKNFTGTAVKRTFAEIFFVSGVLKKGEKETAPSSPAAPAGAATGTQKHQFPTKPVSVEKGSIPKAEGGYTVAELFEKKAELKDKQVKVRGKVVKVNRMIMGKNWVHIQDGTGAGETQDLLITSQQDAKVGDVVLVTGKLALDRNFGSGYAYKLMVEEATFGK